METEMETPQFGSPPGDGLGNRLLLFYQQHQTLTQVALGALGAAILARLVGGSPESVQSAAGSGALAGWFVSEPSEAAGVAAGAILATLIALLAGVHGDPAISLIGSGAFMGFFLSPK